MPLRAIRNARIVTPEGTLRGAVVYDDRSGKITAVIDERETDAALPADSLDARGGYLVPGGVDGHVHLGGFGEIPIADDFDQGSRAALAGGTTTVVDFCEPVAGQSAADCIARRKREAQASSVDYTFHFVLSEEYRRQLADIDTVYREGIGTLKLFTIYENTTLSVESIREIFGFFAARGEHPTFLIHAEEPEAISRLRAVADGESRDMRLLASTRPARTEYEMVRTLCQIARETGTRICIAHTSTAGAVEVKRAWRGEENFLLETCPHYLAFTDEKLGGENGALYTMTPPLRQERDRQALWGGIEDGGIAMLCTDHCPYHESDKRNRGFARVPCGVDGIQSRMLYLFSEGVVKRNLSLRRYVELTAENAAKFYGLYPRKGCIRPGSDADLVLIDPDAVTEWRLDRCHGKIDYTIYEGMRFQGGIAAVIRRGETVYDGTQLRVTEGTGQFLPTAHQSGERP